MFAAVLLREWLQPIPAGMAGLGIGAIVGTLVWCAVRVWPFVRIVWWWSGELTAVIVATVGWVQLNRAPLVVVAIVMAVIGASFILGPVRRVCAAVVWCAIVRHRLRSCFAQFIVANQSGSLPWIFIAKPTPVGERVWIYLRPGLSPADLQSRLEKIAVACHASAVNVERASARTAGFVRVDVKRREVLGGLVGSPLTDTITPTPATGPVMEPVDAVNPVLTPGEDDPIAWARTDLSDAPVSPAPTMPTSTKAVFRPAPPEVKVPAPAAGDDLTDWI